jgi:alcohol dehydrogenase (cytochrome c)
MKAWKYSLVFASIALLRAFSDPAMAQNLEPAALAHPSSDSWPTYHGDYSGKRHSKLTQITRECRFLLWRGRFRQIRISQVDAAAR